MSEPTPPKRRSGYLQHVLDACFIGGVGLTVGVIVLFTLLGVAGLAEGVHDAHKRATALETRMAELEKQLQTRTVHSVWPVPTPVLTEVRR